MPKLKFRFYILAVCLLLLSPFQAFSEEADNLFSSKAPVDITADFLSYDKATETYYARGNVEITQEGTTLISDSAMLDMTTGVATAYGDVRGVDEGGNTVTGESFQFNTRDKTAVLVNGRIFYKEENIHITADILKKTGPETYTTEKVTYTTCDCPEPDKEPAWSFYASRAKVTVGEFLTGRNAFFNIKGVPVFYTPYISVPIKRDRQTGFLQPRPGYSRLRGFVLQNSFFWAISRNTDATFYLDVETTRGIGKGIEYRYIRTRKSSGELNIYHFKEKDIDRVREFRSNVNNLSRPATATDDRWRLQYKHHEILWNDINLRVNLDLVSDDEYFIDFGKNTQDRSLESLESNISLSKSWSAYSLVAQWRFFNNLVSANDKSTLQRLPEVTFTGSDKKILNSPFYLSLESSLINFVREEGVHGLRLDVHPRLSLPLNPGGYFDIVPSIAPRATFYLAKDDPNGRFADRYLYEFKVDATTTFVKILETGFDSLQALKHTIRPKVTYSYVPEAVQTDLPSFDGVDNIGSTNSITYSLNTTLTAKIIEDGIKRYFEYIYLDVSQSYNINEATKKLSSPEEKRRPFSEISAELIVRPSVWVTATAKGKYDVYKHWFNSYDTSLIANDKRGDNLNLSYRFVRDGSRYLEASARAKTIKSIDLTYLNRYSFDEARSLETTYGMEYTHQCWSTVLTYTERLEEKIVFITFTLKGLGKVAGIQGRLEPK
ncbi:MAG: LPS-assembly protein LptD [Deltaproteobacteria bacterium]|nr:LPS-assembly protein LptD [Deltaproteobacteria bacterium]